MPGEVPLTARLRALLLGCAALLLAAQPAGAAQALITADVPAGKWKGVRLKNLPEATRVAIQAESGSGSVDLIFIHGEELKRFPAAVSPEFQGTVERKLSFSVTISRKGDYYVILDNRRGSEPRKVRLLIRAERAKKPQSQDAPAPPPPAAGKGPESKI
jgi:hypothetical protein